MDTTGSDAVLSEDVTDGWIAITGQGREGAGRIPLLYARGVDRAGGHPRVYSPFDQLRDEETVPAQLHLEMSVDPDDTSPLDGAIGLLLPGGGDIDPAVYGEPRHPRTKNVSKLRDRIELTLLREALRRDMPVLCICRGFQLLNVHLGGTLDQHLADHPERLEHDRDMPRAEPAHSIRIKEGSPLVELLDGSEIPVNSHHHQGLGRIADGLEEVAWSGDGVLEAVIATDFSWVLGVQWHPEVMAPVDHRQMRIFERFVAATARYAESRAAA
ncbi:MAG TPA: gamma-glutamyl-gamma-aminobutyrate hydrolase family protein [Actinomycetota bacterium]|nr:gamma-glutamyl-gamma-aminobutyrate hydrolase family protein [Actinomycetota bacterium]